LNWQLIDFKELRKDRAMTNNNLTNMQEDRTQQAIGMIEEHIIKLEQEFETRKERMIDEVKDGLDISFAAESYYEAREKLYAYRNILFKTKNEGVDKTIRQLSYDLQNGCYLPINDGIKRIEEYWRFRAFSHVLNILERFKDRQSS
jgi:hypothetical protein